MINEKALQLLISYKSLIAIRFNPSHKCWPHLESHKFHRQFLPFTISPNSQESFAQRNPFDNGTLFCPTLLHVPHLHFFLILASNVPVLVQTWVLRFEPAPSFEKRSPQEPLGLILTVAPSLTQICCQAQKSHISAFGLVNLSYNPLTLVGLG